MDLQVDRFISFWGRLQCGTHQDFCEPPIARFGAMNQSWNISVMQMFWEKPSAEMFGAARCEIDVKNHSALYTTAL